MKKYITVGAIIFPILCFMIPFLNIGAIFIFNTLNMLSLGMFKLFLSSQQNSENSIIIALVIVATTNAIIGGIVGFFVFTLREKMYKEMN